MRLGISGHGEIYVAMVDPDGTIHVLIEGDVTDAKVAQLRGLALISLSAGHSGPWCQSGADVSDTLKDRHDAAAIGRCLLHFCSCGRPSLPISLLAGYPSPTKGAYLRG